MRQRIVAFVILVVATIMAWPLGEAVRADDVGDRLDELEAMVKEMREAHRQSGPAEGLGRTVYRANCAACHGIAGDGKTREALALDPRPRDFTTGTYKWRSTVSGAIPSDFDLYRTVTEGLTGTRMPSWYGLLTPRERYAVVQYIKTFSARFSEEALEEDDFIKVPEQAPPATAQSITRGREVYQANKCAECHGALGRGDGPNAGGLQDEWGQPIRPYDFTRGGFRSGPTERDIYRTFMTGLDGTPMPSYRGVISEDDAWALAHYVKSLVREPSFLEGLFGDSGLDE